ncbi:MAG: thermonuclease family protein [Thermodesulfobacteriota bacterium]|nr:thermonuclease family protein [Thermodesulfobacteriota bacterium]
MRDKRKKVCLVVCLLVLWAHLFIAPVLADMVATVAWVFDGDTIKLSNGTKIRYAGINTPEVAHNGQPAQPLADEAYLLNRRLTRGRQVRIQVDKEKYDQYGRMLAYVFLPDGAFVNGALVEKGLAMVYTTPPNVRYDQDLLTLQRRAMRERVGLWAAADPGKEPFYIGNTRSRRFHSPSCHLGQKTGRRNKVVYRNRLEAFYDGLSPCKKCNP